MKNVMTIFAAILMVATLSVSAFAAPGAFIESISGQPTPGVISVDAEGCDPTIVITPYSERDSLDEDERGLFEDAYDGISSTDDVKTLSDDLADVAGDKTVAVSDFFDIDVENCDHEAGQHDFDIVLDADTLENFVALMQYNEDGTWSLVKGAQVVANGEHLQFTLDTLSPLAIVVETGVDAPQTNDDSMVGVYLTIMAVSAVALVVVLGVAHYGKKKQSV